MRCFLIIEEQYYEVQTHWGWFRLDSGAYEDYLKGRLWISWVPGKKQTEISSGSESLPEVGDEALRLRDEAEKCGAYELHLQRFSSGALRLPYKPRMSEVSVDELCLSVRSSNALMRANAGTLGKVAELMDGAGLKTLRNLGAKSEREITRCMFAGCYALLTAGEKAAYWQALLK